MQTVIGAFDDRETAQQAVEKLAQAGVPRDDVHVQQGEAGSGTTHAAALQDGGTGPGTQDRWQGMESEVALDRGVLSSIGNFFTSLFGQDHPSGHAGTYSEAVRRGSSVVVVDARDAQEAERAVTLLHELGAIDIDERADQWRAGGWTGGAAQPADQNLRAGVRVVDRATQPPLREIVRRREEQERPVIASSPVDDEDGADKPR
ncbi:MAG: hypothetical protein JWQ33_1305 [Ramlibacter sp.]|nr:hypothetical protein [Ramlibacter sp.]